MSTLLWVLVTYLAIVAISFPIIKAYYKKVDLKYKYFSPVFMAIVQSFIPMENLIVMFEAIFYWRKVKKTNNVLDRLAKKYKNDPELYKQLKDIADQMRDYNKLKE